MTPIEVAESDDACRLELVDERTARDVFPAMRIAASWPTWPMTP
jgi:hypothetical protein